MAAIRVRSQAGHAAAHAATPTELVQEPETRSCLAASWGFVFMMLEDAQGLVNVLAERTEGLDPGVPDPEQVGRCGSAVAQPAIGSHDFR